MTHAFETFVLSRLPLVLRDVQYPGLEFIFTVEPPNAFLHVFNPRGTCNRGPIADGRTGAPLPWNGRKWRLSPHMTDGEVVQTAFLAVLQALEHEAREKFTYKGVTVFDPHYDIDRLVQFRQTEGATKGRDDHA